MYDFYRPLLVKNDSKIVLLVLDGLGGLQQTDGGLTELAAASTPNLDGLASRSSCGLFEPVMPGVTPGSGPSHMALFGYDPQEFPIGRGVLEALGSDFPVKTGDLCIRVNFATADGDGTVVDRRAGRISTEEMTEICGRLQEGISAAGFDIFFHPVKEHRAALVIRGAGLYEFIADTDPQVTGKPPLPVAAEDPDKGRATVELLEKIVADAGKILAKEPRANALLLRGISFYHPLPTMEERFGLRSVALAAYPMYRGLAGLVGMTVDHDPSDWETTLDCLDKNWDDYDFFFIHYKKTDSSGEDGDFEGKKRMIEIADSGIPRLLEKKPDVLAVTGDHSTPALLANHSWHPVPLLLHSKYALHDRLERFDEVTCARGSLGLRPSYHLMALLLANALRLKKYGA
jgi:2,3-bisphosphoglycerate-independent phosphoglycerate mutase